MISFNSKNNMFEIHFEPDNNERDPFDFNFLPKVKSSDGCLHDQCPECTGSGRKRLGGACVHMLSCPCNRCTPTF